MITAMWKTTILAVAFTCASAGAMAEGPCDKRHRIADWLAEIHRERPVGAGITDEGRLIEVFSTGNGATWTIVMTSPQGLSCILSHGEDWNTRKRVATGPRI